MVDTPIMTRDDRYVLHTYEGQEGELTNTKFTNGGKWLNINQIYSRILP